MSKWATDGHFSYEMTSKWAIVLWIGVLGWALARYRFWCLISCRVARRVFHLSRCYLATPKNSNERLTNLDFGDKKEISGALFNILYHKDLQERKSPSNKSRRVIFWGSTLQRTVWSQRDWTKAFLCRAWGERRERHVGPRTFRSGTLWRRSGFWFLRRERRSCRWAVIVSKQWSKPWLGQLGYVRGWHYYPGIIGIIQKKHEVNGSLLTNQYFNGMSRTSGNDAALGGESHHKETRIQTPRLP